MNDRVLDPNRGRREHNPPNPLFTPKTKGSMFRNQYDTDVTTWSPQGRLFQVEYAMESVKQGSACVGLTSATHVVIAALKRAPSELASHQQKCFKVDEHIGMVISGLTSDGRSLLRKMRGETANHKFVYDSALQVERLMSFVGAAHQRATQSYVRRPYGVGCLVAGVDRTGPHLFQTCPSGNMSEWKAYALGSRSQAARTYLERNFSTFQGLSRDALIREAAKTLHACLEAEKELDMRNTVIGVVGKDEAFHIYEGEEVAIWIAGLGAAVAGGTIVVEEEAEAAGGAGGAGGEEMGEGGGGGEAAAAAAPPQPPPDMAE